MKIISILCLSLFLVSCKTPTINDASLAEPLATDEGYFVIVINTYDRLSNIRLKKVDDFLSLRLQNAEPGSTLMLLKVKTGEYCFEGFNVYNLRVTYDNKGYCTYVEAGEVNYFGHFIVRDPVSTKVELYDDFVARLHLSHPSICEEFIGEACGT